jgi:ribosome-binding factor A
VTVTACEVSRDLRTAKVFVSILGDDQAKASALEGLHGLAPQLRGPIGRALRLRAAPELFFKVDQSVAYAARIETLLAQIKPPPADGDTADTAAENPRAGDDDDSGD